MDDLDTLFPDAGPQSVRDALDKLDAAGSWRDMINMLVAMDIRGCRGDTQSCPVAVYLHRTAGITGHRVGAGTVSYSDRGLLGVRWRIPLPFEVANLIDAVDHREAPEITVETPAFNLFCGCMSCESARHAVVVPDE